MAHKTPSPAEYRKTKIYQQALSNADRIVRFERAEDAEALPGLHGLICAAHLAQHGFYAATVAGLRTLYLLEPEPAKFPVYTDHLGREHAEF